MKNCTLENVKFYVRTPSAEIDCACYSEISLADIFRAAAIGYLKLSSCDLSYKDELKDKGLAFIGIADKLDNENFITFIGGEYNE